ncbi:hypothetical protein HPB49_022930 [Dermacentor silvarum]|uniref:Uncharacterized protein n=1 Tax=Dermacentor silvarum TaxID=543639 RepID=A0ACB8C5V3_DERSI|nr:hypothetical protein HPB49_022930 [Dermacentor silvarum]
MEFEEFGTFTRVTAPDSSQLVCGVHFDPSCLEPTTSYTDWKTGKVVEVPLPVPHLRPESEPSVFPGCPSYLSKEKQSSREAPDIK